MLAILGCRFCKMVSWEKKVVCKKSKHFVMLGEVAAFRVPVASSTTLLVVVSVSLVIETRMLLARC